MDWLAGAFGVTSTYGMHLKPQRMRAIAVRLRIPVPAGTPDGHVFQYLLEGCPEPDDLLDLVDAALMMGEPASAGVDRPGSLRQLLRLGGSVWTVSSDGRALQLVVDDAAQASVDAVLTTQDDVSTELGVAWAKAYGREPDASDAWDHAIKAVELVIDPVVIPGQSSATLGKALGQLRSQGHLYEFVLPGTDGSHSVAPLVAMLELLWPNPDRHGGQGAAPGLEEARGVVQVAVAIVQMHRGGWVVRRR